MIQLMLLLKMKQWQRSANKNLQGYIKIYTVVDWIIVIIMIATPFALGTL